MNPSALPVLICWAVAAMFSVGAVMAQEKASVEYKVKAAYLLNFAKFVEWPTNRFPTATSPIKVGVLGKDPFGPDLDRIMEGRVIDGRKPEIIRASEPEAGLDCHIVFVSSSERRRFPEIIETLHKANVLTVGEHEQFVQQGGIIRFFLHDDPVRSESTVRFEINAPAAQKAGLRISSKLLQIAKPYGKP
jgi:hypothetical protein